MTYMPFDESSVVEHSRALRSLSWTANGHPGCLPPTWKPLATSHFLILLLTQLLTSSTLTVHLPESLSCSMPRVKTSLCHSVISNILRGLAKELFYLLLITESLCSSLLQIFLLYQDANNLECLVTVVL